MNALIARIPHWRRSLESGIGAALAALVRAQAPAASTTALYRNQWIGNELEWAPDRVVWLLA